MDTLFEQIQEYNELARECRAIIKKCRLAPMQDKAKWVHSEEGEGWHKKELDSLVADMTILRRKMDITHCPTKAPADPYILHCDKRYRYSELTLYQQVSLEEK